MDQGAIYSSVPEEQLKQFGDHQQLRDFLRENAGQFFKARKLAETCGFRKTGTQVELRKAITELIELGGFPIVSTASGFSWASHPNMIRIYIEGLQHRKMGLQRRIEALRKTFYRMLDENPEFKKDIHNATRENETEVKKW